MFWIQKLLYNGTNLKNNIMLVYYHSDCMTVIRKFFIQMLI